jgi:nitrate/TMAO reductase-like tetraheme cytochrome c subunit
MRSRVIASVVAVWALALTLSARGPESPPASKPSTQPAAAVSPQPPSPPTTDDCLTCHEDAASTRANGTSVAVDKGKFTASVHGGLACVDCHADLAKAELPHADKLAKVDCSSCHDDAAKQYGAGMHARARTGGNDVAATCVSCHGMHDILGSKDPNSRTYHLNVAATCSNCHGKPEAIAKGHIAAGDVGTTFSDSIHGRALSRSGLLVAPTCSDCHGAHDVRPKSDPASRVAMANVPATCGKCHEGIAHQFGGSVHAAMLAKGTNGAPACQTCHTAHAIQAAANPKWQLAVVNQCGTCHDDKLTTYRDTFHGKATALGFRAVATCADCHGNHGIRPASDPASPIAKANLVKTCGKCHAEATTNFVKYDPHADKDNRERNAGLFFATRFMKALLIGTFAFFGLHTLLWLIRGLREGPPRAAAPKGDGDV